MIVAMVTRPLDSLIARGNTSDVFRLGKHAVIKVLRPGIPDTWAIHEAEITGLVHAAGLPAPSVLHVTTVEGRPAIVFERVAGASMWDRMLAHPRDIPRLARVLAELQAEINATPPPSAMPRLVDRLRENIKRAGHLSSSDREVALADLEHESPADALCHFDVHPNNVLMGATEPIIIDWFDAAAGDPAADIVRSSLLMRSDAAASHLPCVDASVIDVVHDAYIASVIEVRDVDVDLMLGWERAVVASRLAEPMVDSVRWATTRMWRALKASKLSPIAATLQSYQ